MTDAFPMVFYPAMAVNLVLRFDEALLKGQTPDGVSAASLASGKGNASGGPVAEMGYMNGANEGLTYVIATVPTRASIELPSFRCAAKFSLTFAFRDLPVDPRVIRAMGVRVYVGTVPDSDFARGIRGETVRGRLASQLAMNEDNLRLVGTVDTISVLHDDKGSEFTIEGRGLQGIFLDARVTAKTLRELQVNQPIHQVVTQLLAKHGFGKEVNVKVNSFEWPDNFIPAPNAPELITRMNMDAAGKQPVPGGVGADPNAISFWDVITTLCNLVGAIPYFEGRNLRIRPARSIYDQKNAGQPGNPTPFKGGKQRQVQTSSGTVAASYRKMVYGKNLLSFQLDRRLGGMQVPSIRCVAVDPGANVPGKGRLLEVIWPDEATGGGLGKVKEAKKTKVSPSGDASTQEVITIPIYGIKDKKHLRNIAQQIYEEIGRGELGGSFATLDLASFGGSNADADILSVQPGDAIEFTVDAAGLQVHPPTVSELNNQASEPAAKAVETLSQRLGGRRDLAQLIVNATRNQVKGLQDVFRVCTARYDWDINGGIAVSCDFQNYVEARYDVGASSNGYTPPTIISSGGG